MAVSWNPNNAGKIFFAENIPVKKFYRIIDQYLIIQLFLKFNPIYAFSFSGRLFSRNIRRKLAIK